MQQVKEAAPPAAQTPRRPARALIGWMEPDKARLALAGNQMNAEPSQADGEVVRLAQEAVAARVPSVSSGVTEPLAVDLAEHLARVAATAGGAGMLGEGWEPVLIDLTTVCAMQRWVFTDSADRVAGITRDDLGAVAKLTMPVAQASTLQAQYDEIRRVWTLASANPNLQVAGQFAGTIAAGGDIPLFGFFATERPSFLHAARFRGRLILRDGYHRALALLEAGITKAPGFVRQLDTYEQLAVPGMLPQGTYLGDRPPTLVDYFDDAVSHAVELPAFQKLVVVQALELNPPA
jgi:hypothetical protein